MKINSIEWWDDYFLNHWENEGGSFQTAFFARIIISHLPLEVIEFLNGKNIKFLDFGCALGQALHVFHRTFEHLNLFGYDFSKLQ